MFLICFLIDLLMLLSYIVNKASLRFCLSREWLKINWSALCGGLTHLSQWCAAFISRHVRQHQTMVSKYWPEHQLNSVQVNHQEGRKQWLQRRLSEVFDQCESVRHSESHLCTLFISPQHQNGWLRWREESWLPNMFSKTERKQTFCQLIGIKRLMDQTSHTVKVPHLFVSQFTHCDKHTVGLSGIYCSWQARLIFHSAGRIQRKRPRRPRHKRTFVVVWLLASGWCIRGKWRLKGSAT